MKKKAESHKIYIGVLRKMSPEQRLFKALELSELTRKLFIHGLHKRFPNLKEHEFEGILMERLNKCYSRSY